MRDWQDDKKWADTYLPEIKRVIRSIASEIIAVEIASDGADRKRATDYVVTVPTGDVACRVRKWQYWNSHHDFTLRSFRPSGIRTELTKIQEGYARWYLYAWGKGDFTFGAWVWIDLDILRDSGLLDIRAYSIRNRNGSSRFRSWSLQGLDRIGCLTHCGGAAVDLLGKRQLQLFPRG